MDSNQNPKNKEIKLELAFERTSKSSTPPTAAAHTMASQTNGRRPLPSSEILQPMNATPIREPMRPRPLKTEVIEDEAPRGKGGSILMLILFAVIGRFVAKALVGGMVGVSAEEAEKSKMVAWTTEFKQEFISSCNAEAVSQLKAQPALNQMALPILERKAAAYCECMVGKVEAAHIIKTKFESSLTIAQIKNETSNTLNNYLNSPDGKSAVDTCVAN